MRIRALTYNIHKGFCFYSRQYVLQKLKTAIHEVGADIVFLQEVMGVHPEKENGFELASQFEYLADSLWPHYAYGKNAVYDSGHHGNAILSKFPFVQHSNKNISTNPFEQRGLLHGEVLIAQTPVHLFCTHFDLRERGRQQQLQWLHEEVSQKVPAGAPAIVAGDFNDWRRRLHEEIIVKMNFSEIGHHKTFPTWFPFWSMDRMYVRGLQVHASGALKDPGWKKLSDHLPLMAELGI